MFMWMLNYCSLFPIVLESLLLRFLVSARKVEVPKSYLARDRVGCNTSKLALANLVELLAITPDKPTYDPMGNRPSSIIRVNAYGGEINLS
jgi:hypothetical protein